MPLPLDTSGTQRGPPCDAGGARGVVTPMSNLPQYVNLPDRRASRYSRPITGCRRFAVGDVHGCLKTLRTLVEEVLRLEKDDGLFLLGDYIDRGPDSPGVLEYLLSLLAAGYDVRPLMGNHEEMLRRAASDPFVRKIWLGNGGDLTLQQFGVDSSAQIPRRYLDFMAGLPHLLTTDDYVFVHAGLDFLTDNPVTDTTEDFMLWERNWNFLPEKLAGKTLVCGHTITPLVEIRASLQSPAIFLDNGCFAKGEAGYGSLVALNLDTRKLLVQENCD